ncbi:hydroxymethylbilane synthase [Caulobacter sp. NIBR1757]|uniref:hydroxymethylbilane synthase n=1 Tax=Caulobacter sp. NIBR1757 TaxID=3016000 RepID=UPI0022F0FA5E|nr:hydroxymethylbilane synthase [Caulobacter sp. NIBR1757]WGM37284.1 Porphobilinogen deaminase [Caulobacter sp. NIBR1757]
MSPQPVVRIGTRASKLALAQSRMMQLRIATALGAPDRADEIAPLVRITTTGDRIQDRRLLEVGGKALFTKEIEEALLDGRIDAAVHSMKDVPAEMPPGLAIAAIPEREDPRDAFISEQWETLEDLPHGARLGTASLRRAAQCLAARPDLEIIMLRGNVDTRLAKLAQGEADAILLAASGLNRLGLGSVVKSFLDPVANPPAPGQGALAIQTREADIHADWLAAVCDLDTVITVAAERGALAALEGSCRTAIGAHALLNEGHLTLIVEALTPDGTRRFRKEGGIMLPEDGAEAAARALGRELGDAVRLEGGDAIVLHD